MQPLLPAKQMRIDFFKSIKVRAVLFLGEPPEQVAAELAIRTDVLPDYYAPVRTEPRCERRVHSAHYVKKTLPQLMRYLVIAVLMALSQYAEAQTNYTRSIEIPALRITFSEMQSILDKASKLATSANAGGKGEALVKSYRETLKVRSGTTLITMDGRDLSPSGAKVPDKLDLLTYLYVGGSDSPIGAVSIDLNDSTRLLTVSGQSPEQVDAIVAAVREDVTQLSSSLGGRGIVLLLGVPGWIFMAFIVAGAASAWAQKRTPLSRAVLWFTCMCLLLMLLMPTSEIFSGFIVSRLDPSITARYSTAITIIGLLTSLLPVLAPSWLFRGKPSSEQAATEPRALEGTPVSLQEKGEAAERR